LLTFIPEVSFSCPMCGTAVDAGVKAGKHFGSGLNSGILYLMCVPYLLIMGIGIFWYKNSKRPSSENE